MPCCMYLHMWPDALGSAGESRVTAVPERLRVDPCADVCKKGLSLPVIASRTRALKPAVTRARSAPPGALRLGRPHRPPRLHYPSVPPAEAAAGRRGGGWC